MRPERGHCSDGVAHIVLFACARGKQVSNRVTLQFEVLHKPWILPVSVPRASGCAQTQACAVARGRGELQRGSHVFLTFFDRVATGRG